MLSHIQNIPPQTMAVRPAAPSGSFSLAASPTALIDDVFQGLLSGTEKPARALVDLLARGAPVVERAVALGKGLSTAAPVLRAVIEVLSSPTPAGTPREDWIAAQLNFLTGLKSAYPGELRAVADDNGMLLRLENAASRVTIAERNEDGTFRFNPNLNRDLTITPMSGAVNPELPKAAYSTNSSAPGTISLPVPLNSQTTSPASAPVVQAPAQTPADLRLERAEATLSDALEGLGDHAREEVLNAIGARYRSDVDAGLRSNSPEDQQRFLAGLYNEQKGWTDVAGDIFTDAAKRLAGRAMDRMGVPDGQRGAYYQAIRAWSAQFEGKSLEHGLNALAALPDSPKTWNTIGNHAKQLVLGGGGVQHEAPRPVDPEEIGNTKSGVRPDLETVHLPEMSGPTSGDRPNFGLAKDIWTNPDAQLVPWPPHTGSPGQDQVGLELAKTSFPIINPGGGSSDDPLAGTQGPQPTGAHPAPVELTDNEREQAAGLAGRYKKSVQEVEGIMKAARQVMAGDPTRIDPHEFPELVGASSRATQVLDLLKEGHPSAWAMEAGLKLTRSGIDFAKQHAPTIDQLREVVSSETSLRHALVRGFASGGNDYQVRGVIGAALQRAAANDNPVASLDETATALAGLQSGAISGVHGYAALTTALSMGRWPPQALEEVFASGRFDGPGMAMMHRAFPEWSPEMTPERLDVLARFLRQDLPDVPPNTIAAALRDIADGTHPDQVLAGVQGAAAGLNAIAVPREESGRVFAQRVEEAATALDSRMTILNGALSRLTSGRHTSLDINELTSPANQAQIGLALDYSGKAFINDGSVPPGLSNDDLDLRLTIGSSLDTNGGRVSRSYTVLENSGDSGYTVYGLQYRNGPDGEWQRLEAHTGVELPPGSSVRYGLSNDVNDWVEIPLP